jgi:hypothetical protein
MMMILIGVNSNDNIIVNRYVSLIIFLKRNG